jgi:hypothetical protein
VALTFEIVSPPIVVVGQTARVRIALIGAGVFTPEYYMLDPDGIESDITTRNRFTGSATRPWNEFDFVPAKVGCYSFWIKNTATGEEKVCAVYCEQWAGYIDYPISTLNKLRSEMSRVRTTVKKGV